MTKHTLDFPNFLREEALKITPDLVAIQPTTGAEFCLKALVEIIPTEPYRYSIFRGLIAFTYEDGYYVRPYNPNIPKLLEEQGIIHSDLYVPFCNGEEPKDSLKWQMLQQKNRFAIEHIYFTACKTYGEEHHIKDLQQEFKNKCFSIPINGMKVQTKQGKKSILYPILIPSEIQTEQELNDCLGKYSFEDNKTAFIDNDGFTYVAKGKWIIPILEDLGYTEGNFEVPLSHNEIILNSNMREVWEELPSF